MQRGRLLAWLVLALVTLSVPACDEHTKLAEVDEPEARIEYVLEKSLGGSGNHFACNPRVIRVEKAYVFSGELKARLPGTWNENDSVVMSGDPAGKRLAYRQNGGKWRPIWIGKQHLLVGSDGFLIAGESLDFSKLPDLAGAAPRIFGDNPSSRSDVIAEIKLIGGRALETFLIATRDVASEPKDHWDDAYRGLKPSAKSAVDAALNKDLLAGKANQAVLFHIARGKRLSTEAERKAALSAAAKLDVEKSTEADTLAAIAAQAAAIDLAATADFACRRAQRDPGVAMLHWIMAAAKKSCAGAALAIEEGDYCAGVWRCSGALDSPACTPGELEPRIRSQLDAAATKWLFPVVDAELGMVLAVRTDAVPEPVRLANERRRYKPVQSGGDCELSEAPDKPCTCAPELLAEAACRAGDPQRVVTSNCRFSINDAQRTVGSVRSVRAGKVVALRNADTLGCAVTADQRVQCWSASTSLSLPVDAPPQSLFNPSYTAQVDIDQSYRAQLKDLVRVTQVASSPSQACALDADGRVWCFGGVRKSVERVLDDCLDLALGRLHACAASKDGKLRCWGSNNMGQIPGLAVDSKDHPDPHVVPGLAGIRAVRAQGFFSCALGAELRCWGDPAGEPQAVPGSQGATLFDVRQRGGYFVKAKQLFRFSKSKEIAVERSVALPGTPTDLAPSGNGVALLIGSEVHWLAHKESKLQTLGLPPAVALGRNDADATGTFLVVTKDGRLLIARPPF